MGVRRGPSQPKSVLDAPEMQGGWDRRFKRNGEREGGEGGGGGGEGGREGGIYV